MKLFRIFLLLICAPLLLFADTNTINDLEARLKSASEKEKVFLLNDIFLEYSEINFKKAIDISEKATNLSKKLNDKQLEARSYLNLGNVYYEHCEYEKALSYFQKSLLLYKKFYSTNYVDINYALNNIAVVYEELGEYTNALCCYLKTLRTSEQEDDIDGIATANVNLGSLYDSLGLHKKALSFLTNALCLFRMENSTDGTATTLGNLSSTYLNLGDYNKALKYQFDSLELEKEIDNKAGMAISYSSIADIYVETTNYNKAIENYNNCIGLANAIDNKNILCGALSGLGNVYFNLKQYDKALSLQKQVLKIALEINSKEQLHEFYKNLAETYYALGNYKKATEFLKKYDTEKDNVFNDRLAKQMLKMENIYKYEKQKYENSLLKSKAQLQEVKLQKLKLFLIISGSAIVVLIVSLASVLYTIRKRRILEVEKQRLQKRLQHSHKMENIGLLAGSVAHDLNNVLSGIVSYPDLLLMEIPENSPLRQPLITIKESGEKAAAIVQDLLTLARRGVNTSKVLNPNCLILNVINSPEFNNLKACYPQIEIKTNLNPAVKNIKGSELHLKKMIVNLITNATEAKGNLIEISTKNHNHKDLGQTVCITVKDNGEGISEKDIKKIFEPFYTKKSMGRSGTGLGMTIVWNTIQDHNGKIEIISKVATGTTINVFLPSTNEKSSEKNKSILLDNIIGNGESILVIDDNDSLREITKEILLKLGYSVVTVNSGEKAIQYIKDNNVDLIVLDMILGKGLNGLETYKEILKFNVKQKAIIVSGFSENLDVKFTQILGAGSYIKKPYSIECLGLAIKNELNKN